MTPTSTHDRGSTLTELLITVVITGIIMTVLTSAIVMFLRNESSTTDRIDRTRGVQQLVNYLPTDVGSAQRIEIESPWTNPCLTLGAPILNLAWTELFPGAENETVSVTYVLSPDGQQLDRNQCRDGTTSTLTVARMISSARAEIGTDVAGQVDVVLEYDGTERVVTGSSRNR